MPLQVERTRLIHAHSYNNSRIPETMIGDTKESPNFPGEDPEVNVTKRKWPREHAPASDFRREIEAKVPRQKIVIEQAKAVFLNESF